jgi:hypothetical protein
MNEKAIFSCQLKNAIAAGDLEISLSWRVSADKETTHSETEGIRGCWQGCKAVRNQLNSREQAGKSREGDDQDKYAS